MEFCVSRTSLSPLVNFHRHVVSMLTFSLTLSHARTQMTCHPLTPCRFLSQNISDFLTRVLIHSDSCHSQWRIFQREERNSAPVTLRIPLYHALNVVKYYHTGRQGLRSLLGNQFWLIRLEQGLVLISQLGQVKIGEKNAREASLNQPPDERLCKNETAIQTHCWYPDSS